MSRACRSRALGRSHDRIRGTPQERPRDPVGRSRGLQPPRHDGGQRRRHTHRRLAHPGRRGRRAGHRRCRVAGLRLRVRGRRPRDARRRRRLPERCLGQPDRRASRREGGTYGDPHDGQRRLGRRRQHLSEHGLWLVHGQPGDGYLRPRLEHLPVRPGRPPARPATAWLSTSGSTRTSSRSSSARSYNDAFIAQLGNLAITVDPHHGRDHRPGQLRGGAGDIISVDESGPSATSARPHSARRTTARPRC